MRLEGKIAAVTGAASGIGKGIALDLAREGAAVAIGDIDEAAASEAATAIAEETGSRTFSMPCDVTSRSAIDAFIGETAARFGGVDIVVANAGVGLMQSSLETTEDDWDRTMDVNARGVFFTDQSAARQMIAQGRGGVIVNLASIASFSPSATALVYCASKAAVMHLTKCFALELAPHNIRIVAVAPGLVETPIWEKALHAPGVLEEGLRQRFAESIPLQRMARPEDIANMVTFLCSEAGSYTTGHVYVVDGGNSLGGTTHRAQ